MKNTLSPTLAGNILLTLFALLFIFHLLILAGLIPYDIVWAGSIQSQEELVKMEMISLSILALFAGITSLRMGYLTFIQKPIVLNIGMWMVFIFFVLNTVGNLTAKNPIEKYGFGLLTLVMALLALRLAIAPKK